MDSDSHSVDGATGIILAMDLTTLFHDDAVDPAKFVADQVDGLKHDAIARLGRTGGG